MMDKITAWAFDNMQRKLAEANERIVEFEKIKAGHLQILKELKEQIAVLTQQRDLLNSLATSSKR